MRILAIRGQNLASLADPFEVDLEAEPIWSAGIFAVTGPTGAGKSTLLDAICLALFDILPRMDSAERGATVGRVDGNSAQQAKYDDVRGILHHGAGSGYAEVDFVGQDGGRYRARWEANRARGKAAGRLQPERITFTDIESGHILGDSKTETLQQIEKRLGLNAQQFRRAVLLAQGEFDTFIRTPSRDRAELLERITGTQIYSDISRATFARAKQERERVHALEVQLDEHRPLTEAERAAADRRVEEARAELNRIKTEHTALEKAKEWYEARSRLDARVGDAETALGQALEVDQAAEPDRVRLAVTKRAFLVRAELEVEIAARTALAKVERAVANALDAKRRAVKAQDQAVAASSAAKIDRDKKRAAYDAIGLQLDQAQRLDALIESARTELADRRAALARKVGDRDAARTPVTVTETSLETARGRLEEDHRWLAARRGAEALAARIEDVAKDLAEHTVLEGDMASVADRIEHLAHAADVVAAARREREGRLATLQAQEADLTHRLAAARAVAAAVDKPAVEARREAVMRTQAALTAAQEAAGAAGKAEALIASGNHDQAGQESLIDAARDLIARIDAELPRNRSRLEEARRSLHLSEAAGDEAAVRLRLMLEDGQPCPVCGATEHPVTEVDRVLRARVDADRRRVANLEKEVATAQADRARAEARIAAAEDALLGIAKRRSDAEADLQAARIRWGPAITAVLDACSDVPLLVPTFTSDPAEPGAAQPIGPLLGTLARALEDAAEGLRRASNAETEATELSQLRETIRVELESLRVEVARLKEDEQSKAGEMSTLGATRDGLERSRAAVSSRLDAVLTPLFTDWRGRVRDLRAAFTMQCRKLVREWQARRQRAEATGEEIVRLDADLEGKRAMLKTLEAAAAEAETRCAETQCHLDTLAAERAAVIGGRPVGEVRTEYRQRSEAAEQAWNDAELIRAAAAEAVAARSSEVSTARRAVETARRSHESAKHVLVERLRDGGLSREEAEAALARGEAWAQAEQVRLDALREAATTASTTLAERRDAVEQHLAAGIPGLGPDKLAVALSGIEARRAEAADRYGEASGVITQDDHARSRVAEITAALNEQRVKTRVWERLDEIIGSADGAKFRRFAQSLTFNQLVRLANRHLADLHPRYELQRAPGGDLVLQVIDRDMADEVRGVHNLSGGERFLVSLSLALGLASMSSGRGIKIESLFIDEGFGALDSKSLAMAVSALEQLQAAGRRVGVISHVDELKERIAVRVEVTPVGGGRSTVQLAAP
jgi:exonuclease SbcC